MGRKKKTPPDNAVSKIQNLASNGVKETDIAKALGVSFPTWKRWKTEREDIKEAFQEARQIEEEKLFSVLFEKAMAGDTTSLLFILKCRHGWVEGDKTVNANQVNVSITVPGSMNPEQYKKTLEATND